MFYFAFHIVVVVSWMLFLLQFIKSLEYQNSLEGFIFGILSIFFLIITFYLGIKLVSMNMDLLKTQGWLHLKITLAVIIGIENIFYFFKFLKKKEINKKIAEISYWITYFVFVFILFITLLKPF